MRAFLAASLLFLLLAASSHGVLAGGAPGDSHPGQALGYAPGSVVRFEHLTIEDGLSQNAGLALFQDSRGYLWIGTQDGLNRYDGYEITVFKNDPDNPTSLSFNSILAITEDRQGYLWIGTWGGGLNRFDPATGTFTRFQHKTDQPGSLSDDNVTVLRVDDLGRLWAGTLAGLDRLDGNSFVHYRSDPQNTQTLSSDVIGSLLVDSRGSIWVGTGALGIEGAGLNRLDPGTGKVLRYGNRQGLASNNISSLYEAADGTLWIGSGGYSLPGAGLQSLDPGTSRFTQYTHNPDVEDSLSSNSIMSLWGDEDGALWIGTWSSGLNRMQFSRPGRFLRFEHDPYFADSLGGAEIWSLLKDRSGALWVGTSHSGIDKLPSNTGQFSLFRSSPSRPDSPAGDAVGTFAEDNAGNIWIGTWGAGIDRFDPQSGLFTHFRHDPRDPESLSSDTFMTLFVDADDRVWAGTLGRGLDRLDPVSGRAAHFVHDPARAGSLADDNVAKIIPDGQGGLWIGTLNGLSHYETRTGTFINYTNDPSRPESLGGNKVVSLYLDPQNILWVGTWGAGLDRLDLNAPGSRDPRRAAFTHYIHTEAIDSLSENSIWTIVGTPDNALWLGTQAGLNRMDPASGTVRRFTEKDGLPNNVVLGILQDEQNNLWLTTNNGVAKFDPAQETFTHYDTSDGLQSNEFNSNAYLRARSGRLYIGGISGFNSFDPQDIQPNPVPPPVVLTRFELFNEPVAVDGSGANPIMLSYQQDFLSFQFAALDFQAPHKNQYAYRLEGFDREWVQAGNRRFVTYTNLPAGKYVFRVRASNSDGVWNDAGLAVPVIITPPAWRLWWFQLSAGLVGAALLLAGFRWRLNSVRAQTFRLESQIQDRTSELSDANARLEKEVEQRKLAEAELERRASDELKQSEARFQAVFENAAVGIAILTLDRRALAFNPVTERIIGYSLEEMRGISGRNVAVPEDQSIDDELFKELTEGKRDSYVMERRYRHKNGRVFWARINYSLVRDLEGQPDYLIGIIEDIDEERRAVQRMTEAEAEYRRTLEQRVEERTAELQEQIRQRQQMEQALREKAAQEAVTGERTRLARDLHDAVTQTLFSASLIAEVTPEIWAADPAEGRKRLEEVRQLTRGALAEMRTLLVELRPNALVQIPLPDLLRQLCESLIGRARLPIQFNVQGQGKLPADVQISLYRIAQEALNNVVKHAKATQAIVSLRFDNTVRLSIEDNGCGFDPALIPPDHLGLRIMRERAGMSGAELSIYSEPGEGTQISVTWKEEI